LFARLFDEKRQPVIQRRSREKLNFKTSLLYSFTFRAPCQLHPWRRRFLLKWANRKRVFEQTQGYRPAALAPASLFRREVILDGDRIWAFNLPT